MKRLTIKSQDRVWPTVIWQGTELTIFYLGEKEDEVKIKETHGIDFEELFLHLDKGGSIFITTRPITETTTTLFDEQNPVSKPLLKDLL
ncbi:hypothetical protein FJY84_00555 [Candidatus Bathyarchaeota archaeon]|nr:hypothetical protein [Candidatus Bathyarchaeota archaeon]